jgi:hypothetical protein
MNEPVRKAVIMCGPLSSAAAFAISAHFAASAAVMPFAVAVSAFTVAHALSIFVTRAFRSDHGLNEQKCRDP